MASDIFTNPTLVQSLQIISDAEENKYSDIPGWEGGYVLVGKCGLAPSGKAILLWFPNRSGEHEIWFPISQLRRTEDSQSIYASNWILEQKGLP